MYKNYGTLKVQLLEDVDSGYRVAPSQSSHNGDYPLVRASTADKYSGWIGITAEPGKTGDIVTIFPPYSGLVMVNIECIVRGVKTGDWANTSTGGLFTTDFGTGQILTGLIVTPDLDEAPGVGKIVKAMIFTGRFIFDGQPT